MWRESNSARFLKSEVKIYLWLSQPGTTALPPLYPAL
jgi:hypothetical protein